ncbi:hypothetical protein [Alicyclobacillus dauci]|uniref:Uncharacterized protein n=1 Tax=Alicyclobacillus dauci TaxID=1475485 RepID=A0ABY6Z2S7_9BACL|nr:hypothetical protein [Alicyclobacillus dauci]WAH37197.1 hypothetical protein NZD86_01200 [Alicyclobacillus dauci]
MTKESGKSNEETIWEMYVTKCKEEGKEPSVKDFAAWTKSLLANL